jgi:hypothetical protein
MSYPATQVDGEPQELHHARGHDLGDQNRIAETETLD